MEKCWIERNWHFSALDEQIVRGRAQDEQLKFGVKAAEGWRSKSATAQLKQSEENVTGLSRCCRKHFATAEQVDEARTKVAVAA